MSKRLIIECKDDDAYSSILKMEGEGKIDVVESMEASKPGNSAPSKSEPEEGVVDRLDEYKQRM